MFQGWYRRNIPQAKMLTVVQMAVWHQGVVSFTEYLGNQVTSQSIEILPLHAELCWGGPNTFLATRGIVMENDKLNKSMSEELFGGKLYVTEEPDSEKFQARKHRDGLRKFNYRDMGILQKAVEALQEMKIFCRTKKNPLGMESVMPSMS